MKKFKIDILGTTYINIKGGSCKSCVAFPDFEKADRLEQQRLCCTIREEADFQMCNGSHWQSLPKLGSKWLHPETGNIYIVYDITNLTRTDRVKYPISISYRRLKDGTTYSRNLENWPGSKVPCFKIATKEIYIN